MPRASGEAARRTAVVGSGVAGLTAAYVLGHAHHVTLYEADDRLGGHAHTHELASADGRVHRVDSGFIVHNRRTYPNLLRLFDELGVATQESEMSMSVRCEGCGLEYAGARGPAGLFARPRNALHGPYLRMLAQVPRFHRAARRLLTDGADQDLTLGEFLDREGFSPYFRAHFMTPVVSAVWSCDAATALRYPAAYLFRFLHHHGMLAVGGSPVWRTVTGGSRSYVDRIAERLPDVRTATPVRSVARHADGVDVTAADGTTDTYDHLVIAVHPDQALELLADPTPEEKDVLGAFRYSRNATLLHTDTTLLPRTRGARSSWNHLLPSCDAGAGLAFEAVGDAQLARFKADPAHRGRIMDRGLWSWTRHPNYFGDFCVWWGLFLIACDAGLPAAAVSVVSPLVMTYLLIGGSGKRLLERHMADRPGWTEYAARTSGFFPRPPRGSA